MYKSSLSTKRHFYDSKHRKIERHKGNGGGVETLSELWVVGVLIL